MRVATSLLLQCVIVSAIPSALAAQALPSSFQAYDPAPPQSAVDRVHARFVPLAQDTTARRYRSSHWREGMIVGAVAGSVLLGAGFHTLCRLSESGPDSCLGTVVLGGLLGAAIGSVPGALIGGLFPKSPPRGEADSRPSSRSPPPP